jgi:hypothetical protein
MRGIVQAVGRPFSLILTLLLSGCASLQGYAREPESPKLLSDQRTMFFGADADTGYYAATTASERKRLRDLLIYGKMKVIENDFDDLERALNGTGNSISLFGDLTVLGLNSIGAVTGTAHTKAALAAASGGIVGAQGAVSKDLYYQRTLPAILSQMEASRERVRAEIIASMKKSDADYPLPAAEIDLRHLIRAGSVPTSISQITHDANQDQRNSERLIEQARNIVFSASDSSEKINAWLDSDAPANAHFKAFAEWLKAQPEKDVLSNVPVESVVDDDLYEAVRARALADPKLAIPH